MRSPFLKQFVALVLAATVPAFAQQPTPEAATLVPPVRPFKLPPRIGVLAETRISLPQALMLALSSNKDIQSSRIDKEEADYTLLGARGAWDPLLGGNNSFQKQINPVASSLGGSTTGAVLNRNWLFDPSVSGSTPWFGSSYRVDFNNQRTYTNNSFVTLNPQYPSSLLLQYTQPLWRGLRYDSNRHAIDVAKKNRLLTDQQFRQRVMQVIDQTEQAYWELVYAYSNLQVQLEAVEIGRQQDESNRRQQEQGLLAPIDVVAAQTQLAGFELSAFTAQSALTRAENNLKTLMLPDRSHAMWAVALIPTTPAESTPPVTPLDDAINEALANRAEVAQVKISADINQTDVRLNRELLRPQVDLIASYTRQGLAGPIPATAGSNPLTGSFGPIINQLNELSALSGLPPVVLASSPVPSLLVGGYGQSLTNLFNDSFPTTQVQLRVSFPIRNRVAEANLSRAAAETRRIENQREQVEQNIGADVRNGMQGVISAQLRLEAARVQRQSAEEQYQSEQRQFRAGTSTLFLVQQRQTTMITARSQERRAEADLSEAISTYELATGTNLQRHNIAVQ